MTMLTKLTDLVASVNPRVLGQVLKSKIHKDLYTWVLNETQLLGNVTITERVYYLTNNRPEVFCKYGQKKTLRLAPKEGYGFCNSSNKCQCMREHLKDNYTPKDMTTVVTKRKITWLNKYGVDNPSRSADVINKKKQTIKQRDYSKLRDQLAFDKQTNGFLQVVSRVSSVVTPKFTREEYNGSFRKNEYPWECVKCSNVFTSHIDYGTVPKCKKCYPATISSIELEVSEYIQSLGIPVERNNRTLLDGKELDLYIPSKQIAVECNGVYWHSAKFKDRTYHVSKFIKCRDKGVHLVQIFEDEWINKKNIIKERLRSVLGANTPIYARKCVVKHIDGQVYTQFTNSTHLQGTANATYRYGLFYNNMLMAVMSFSKSRYTKTGYELIRYCSIGNVVGGASKLFAAFCKEHNPKLVISYANRCWSNGNLYTSMGFTNVTADDYNTGYWYIKNNVRYHRSNFTKAKLVGLGYDQSLTESKIMEDLGYHVLYDAGNYKFQWSPTT